jgi:hypothetical protein
VTVNILRRDPLLTAAKLVVGGAIGILIFCLVMVAVGLGAVLTVEHGTVMTKLAEAGIGASGFPMVILALALIAAMVSLYIMFMLELYRIVGSVDDGDPFSPANAGRLQKMGWLNLAVQLILFALAGIGVWLGDLKSALLAEDAINLGIGAIVLTLVLFILARIFRLGTQMRDDLEGTV